jgi:ADP-ribose pyrophosphatase YjhB (NUDIX family)
MSRSRRQSTNSVRLTLAAAIVIHNGCVLIVRRSKKEKFLPGNWGVPCGKVDVRGGERAREAVLRELREETGLTGEVRKYVDPPLEFKSSWHGRPALNVQYNYLVALKVDESAKRTRWFSRIRAQWSSRMPPVKTPRRDQESKWVPLDRLDQEHLDKHNRKAIDLAVDAYSSVSDTSSDAMVSSLHR